MSKIRLPTPINLYYYLLIGVAGLILIIALVADFRTVSVIIKKPLPPAPGTITPQEQTLNEALSLLSSFAPSASTSALDN